MIRCCSCSNSFSEFFCFHNSKIFFSSTSPSFFQNPTFATAAVQLVKYNGKVKIIFSLVGFFLFCLKSVRFAGVIISLHMICSQMKAWGKFQKLFYLEYCFVINASVFFLLNLIIRRPKVK